MKLQEILDCHIADLEEKWTKKYKKSINCNAPKGFSQRAHCAARRKRRAGGTTTSKSVSENQLPSITEASDILLDIDYYMNEGCGIFAVALGLNYSGSEVYIISNNNGEIWGRLFPYEITHVFVKLPNRGTWDAKGQRTIEQMAKDFHLDRGQYSVKGPFGPKEFAQKFMSSKDSKPLYGTKEDIQALQTQLKNWAEPTVDTVTSQGDPSQIRQQRITNENRLDTLVESMLSHLETQGLTEAEAVAHIHERLDEDLRKWFQQKWVRFGPDGKIRGACARGKDSEGKPKCLPQKKAWALGKKKRATAAARKRRQDPNPERKGKAKNVATKESVGSTKLGDLCTIKTNFPDADFWLVRRGDGKNVGKPTKEFSPYHIGIKVTATEQLIPQYLYHMMMHLHNQGYWQTRSMGTTALLHIRTEDVKNIQLALTEHALKENSSCPHCGSQMVNYCMLSEKQDACYYKVKSRYKVWPSAYASGALVQCRKKGAKNWGKGKKQ